MKLFILNIFFISYISSLLRFKEDKLKAILDWVSMNGGDISSLNVKFISNNKYITASRRIRQNDRICSIPDNILINSLHNMDVKKIKEHMGPYKDSEFQSLVVYVCKQMKNSNSANRVFFDSLPEDLTNFPYYYNEEERKLLHNSNFLIELAKNTNKTKIHHEFIKTKFEISFDDYMKCHHIVSSRNFEAEIFGQNYTILVPIFDLFMHEPARNNGTKYMYNKDNRAFELYSTKEYKEGEQIFIDYGDHSNSYFLINHGFTTKSPPLLPENYLKINKTIVRLNRNILTKQLFHLVDEDYNELLATEKIDVYNKTMNLLKERLKEYPTDITYDKKEYLNALKSNSTNKANIYKILIEEKSLIYEYITEIKEIIEGYYSTKLKMAKKETNITVIGENSNKKIISEYSNSAKVDVKVDNVDIASDVANIKPELEVAKIVTEVSNIKPESEVVNKKAVSEVANIKPETEIANKKPESSSNKKSESEVANKKAVSEVANKKPESEVVNKKPEIEIANKKPEIEIANKKPESSSNKKPESEVANKKPESEVANKKPESEVANKKPEDKEKSNNSLRRKIKI